MNIKINNQVRIKYINSTLYHYRQLTNKIGTVIYLYGNDAYQVRIDDKIYYIFADECELYLLNNQLMLFEL